MKLGNRGGRVMRSPRDFLFTGRSGDDGRLLWAGTWAEAIELMAVKDYTSFTTVCPPDKRNSMKATAHTTAKRQSTRVRTHWHEGELTVFEVTT